MAERAPNILFIQADQMAATALPLHGHPVVRAPHIQALGEAGVVFENAYCNSPLCAPSRFSMMSGLLPSTIEAYDNAAEFPAHIPTFAHHLRLMGYRTVLSGKMHLVGPDQLHGFEERLTTDIYPADFGWTPNWEDPEGHQDYFHTMLSVTEAGTCMRSLQLDFDEEVAFQAVRKIYDLARDGDERPFFLLASFTHPHDPYTITPDYWNRYREDEIDLPSVPAIPPEAQDPHSARIQRACGMHSADLTEQRIRNARRAYYGAISYIDDKVGELLAALRASGQDRDTIVLFTADHGDMLGERGLWYKMSFFEGSARVPLIVHAPERFAAQRVRENVSLLDLYPTLRALVGNGGPETADLLPGRSLVPLMEGNAAGDPNEALGEYLAEGAAGPLVMIRRGRHKYVVGDQSPPQLFNLEADPQELENLAGRPEVQAIERPLAEAAAERWDFDALKKCVILSQRRRLLVADALQLGRHAPWDFQPLADASRLYIRNGGDILGDVERSARLPRFEEQAPGAD